MSTGQIIQIVFIALFFIVPALIRVLKSAQEAAARRRMEQMRQAAEYEAMRTGRTPQQVMAQPQYQAPAPMSPQQSAQERLREMAARRQAQIEALRRARMQGGGTATPAPPTGFQPQRGYTPPPQSAARPTPPPRAPQQPRSSNATTRQQRQAQRDAARAQAAAAKAQEFPPPTGEIGGTAHEHEGDVTHRLVPDAPATPPTTARRGPSAVRLQSVGLTDLRKAVLLREILDRPLAMREPGDG